MQEKVHVSSLSKSTLPIEALDIYWYETFDNENSDIPAMVEGQTIQQFYEIYGKLPNWNKEY